MTANEMKACFNEWMRRFIEEPERFSREFENVTEFLKDEADGREPNYGEECAAFMDRLHSELSEKAAA